MGHWPADASGSKKRNPREQGSRHYVNSARNPSVAGASGSEAFSNQNGHKQKKPGLKAGLCGGRWERPPTEKPKFSA